MAMKLDCIRDFIQGWKQWEQNLSNDSKTKWNDRFRDAGYYSVQPSIQSISIRWPEMHKWCEQQFTRDHYAWTGSTFWFENQQDAALFALKWS